MASRKAQKSIGVLLTAVGGPDSLDDVGPFLFDIRGGRPTSPELVAEFRERYAKIGGKSPLLEISNDQAKALEARLNEGGSAFRCYVGMRNWTPRIKDVYARMRTDGLDRIIVLPLTPYHSRRSVGAYFRAVEEAQTAEAKRANVVYVESWNTQPSLLDAFAVKIAEGLKRLESRGFGNPVLVFTAHSLPKKLMEEGDDYERELQETMALLLQRLGPVRTRMAYQSAPGAHPAVRVRDDPQGPGEDGRPVHRVRGSAVHARELPPGGRGLQGVRRDEGVHAPPP